MRHDKLLSRARALRADPVIMTFAGITYWPLAVNFLAALARVDRTLPSRVGIVCLDARIASNLDNLGAPCLAQKHLAVNKRSGGVDVYSLWKLRLQLAYTLTSNGIGVLFSDLDAIWQADATAFYHLYNASAIASRGSFPASANAAWGATLCMGLIAFKPTAGSVALLSELVDACGIACNDQITINEILLTRARLQWASVRPNYALRRGKGVLRGTDMSIVLLPSDVVDRQCRGKLKTFSQRVAVRHCYDQGKPGNKTEHYISLKKHNIWLLRDSWVAVAHSLPLLRYLEHVTLTSLRSGVLTMTR